MEMGIMSPGDIMSPNEMLSHNEIMSPSEVKEEEEETGNFDELYYSCIMEN